MTATRRLIGVLSVLLVVNAASFAGAQQAARGRALCIGLNEVDAQHYGSPLRLKGCKNDATDLATILSGIEGFSIVRTMFDNQATVLAVSNEIKAAAADLVGGDIFVLTIASHGAQLPDLNGDEAELDASDRLDETWLLYDRMWIDDERYNLWKEFKPGVRVLVISDTCHAGTTIRNPFGGSGSVFIVNGLALASGDFGSSRALQIHEGSAIINTMRNVKSLESDDSFFAAFREAKARSQTANVADSDDSVESRGLQRAVGVETRAIAEMSQSVRSIDRSDALAIYAARSNVYDPILKDSGLATSERSPLAASIILLAACQDHQTAADGQFNGAFTGMLKEVWNKGFVGTYESFVDQIRRNMFQRYFEQTPNYLAIGAKNVDFQNKKQRPMSVKTD
jgi:hypothetical protein